MAPLQFVILSDSRSGTSLLSETLNSHPEILCHGEVFHPSPAHHIKGDRKGLTLEDAVALRDHDIDAYMAWVYDHPEARAVGFKMWRSHNQSACDDLIADRTVHKIIYERTNVLARFSSSRLVQATGIYNLPPGKARPGKLDTRITFDRKAFAAYLNKHQSLFSHYRNAAKGPVLDIAYEAIRDGDFSTVLNFLGVSQQDLTPQKAKLHGSAIIDRFEPQFHDTIRAVLDAAGHPEWAAE